jgi:hypothetical protein
LKRIRLVVVEICWIIAITIVHAEVEIPIKIFPDLAATRVGFEQGTTHDNFL